jgi:hypothetical protein
VAMLLGLRERLAVDASDALAVAICHLARARGPGRQNSSSPLGRGSDGKPSAWERALASGPPRRQTPQNALLELATRQR